MISDDGKTPILMDFGSTMQARVHIENRSQALLQQVRIVFALFYFDLTWFFGIGHRSGTKYNGVSRSGAVRRQDRADYRREGRHLGTSISSYLPLPSVVPSVEIKMLRR